MLCPEMSHQSIKSAVQVLTADWALTRIFTNKRNTPSHTTSSGRIVNADNSAKTKIYLTEARHPLAPPGQTLGGGRAEDNSNRDCRCYNFETLAFDERFFEITRLEDWWKQAGACAS